MLIKPSVSFVTTDSDPQLVTRTQTILTTTAENAAVYAAPNPTLPVIQAALNKFSAAIAAAADGGLALTTAKNTARAELVALLRNLASYVQVACNGSMENLLLSGFPIQKPSRTSIGVLPAPGNLTVNLGARTGELDSKVNPVSGAGIYNWKLTASGQAAPLQTAQTTAASNTFDGLTPGVVYSVSCNVVGSAGPSDWSDPISQMVI